MHLLIAAEAEATPQARTASAVITFRNILSAIILFGSSLTVRRMYIVYILSAHTGDRDNTILGAFLLARA